MGGAFSGAIVVCYGGGRGGSTLEEGVDVVPLQGIVVEPLTSNFGGDSQMVCWVNRG